MRSLTQRMPYLGTVRKDGFKRAKTMREGPLLGARLRDAFATLPGNPEERSKRFEAARSMVNEMGGSIDVVSDSKGTMRLKITVEIPTEDRRRDMALHASVAGMGFDLTVQTRSVEGKMQRFYVISERQSGNKLDDADRSAALLVRLCNSLGLKPEEKAEPCSEPSSARAAG